MMMHLRSIKDVVLWGVVIVCFKVCVLDNYTLKQTKMVKKYIILACSKLLKRHEGLHWLSVMQFPVVVILLQHIGVLYVACCMLATQNWL